MKGYSKADIHIHTTYSDGLNEPEAVVNFALTQTDLSVIAITDHNTIDGARAAYAYWKKHRAEFSQLEVIKGIEISTAVGHILGLFLEEDIPARMSAEETIEAIHEQGGLAIAAHPFTHLLPFTDFHGVGRRIAHLDIDGVEERSSITSELYANWMTAHYNQKHQQVARLGSSDAHYLTMIGKTFTWFPGKTAVEFRQAVQQCSVHAGGRINGPIAVLQVINHLIRRRQLRLPLPNDRSYVHKTDGLQVRTQEMRHGPTAVLICSGELTSATADVLKETGLHSLRSGNRQLLIDVGDVTFVDSSGMGAILALHRRLHKREGQLALCQPTPSVQKSIQLLRLDRVIPIYASIDDALLGLADINMSLFHKNQLTGV